MKVTLSYCLKSVDSSAGHHRVADYLKSQPFPHYEAVAHLPGFLSRIDADGSRVIGRFVRRRFIPGD